MVGGNPFHCGFVMRDMPRIPSKFCLTPAFAGAIGDLAHESDFARRGDLTSSLRRDTKR
jgi:hypothetical protein